MRSRCSAIGNSSCRPLSESGRLPGRHNLAERWILGTRRRLFAIRLAHHRACLGPGSGAVLLRLVFRHRREAPRPRDYRPRLERRLRRHAIAPSCGWAGDLSRGRSDRSDRSRSPRHHVLLSGKARLVREPRSALSPQRSANLSGWLWSSGQPHEGPPRRQAAERFRTDQVTL